MTIDFLQEFIKDSHSNLLVTSQLKFVQDGKPDGGLDLDQISP